MNRQRRNKRTVRKVAVLFDSYRPDEDPSTMTFRTVELTPSANPRAFTFLDPRRLKEWEKITKAYWDLQAELKTLADKAQTRRLASR